MLSTNKDLLHDRDIPFSSYSQEVWNHPPPVSYNLIRLNG